ncbi:auxin transport protein BIG [Dorcoceras hygrometricum]|uniref:Auxin transport protein BIG n=1 Tax=Dorcoceras hygrometricum TaxID=472368 RepID=A0A2Z7BQT6_9LAMI|nr:auxin transport protein BIG [Dorcoceras hygrometricum]
MAAEENKSAWTDSDSEESSSGTSSSSESEDEVLCLMVDDTEEVFDFSSPEFTHTELVSSKDMQVALSKLETENENLRSRYEEMLCENQRLVGIISSWTRSFTSLQKLHEATKPSHDRIGLGYNSNEGNTAETSSTPRLERTKFKTMNFVRSSTGQLAEAKFGKDKVAAQPPIWQGRFCGLGYTAPKKSRESWLNKRIAQMRSKSKSGGVKQGQPSRTSKKDWQYRPPHRKHKSDGPYVAYQAPSRSKNRAHK